MARKRLVTRTIKSKEVTALCLDIVTSEPSNTTYIVPFNIKDGEDTIKYLRKKYDTETLKVVSVVDTKTTENLYGMPEEDFIKSANIIEKE